MSWVQVILLALAAFAAMAFVFRAPRAGWEVIGAALLLGVAGYATQASPGLPGASKQAAQQLASDPAALVNERNSISGSETMPNNNWIVIADAMARNGQFANAANVLLGAVDDNPKDGEAWLALANALVAHADGQLTPASLYAFRQAADAEPDHPGAPFFLGMALAQSGRFAEARSLWSDLLERSPEDAPWRADLQMRLERLEAFMQEQGQHVSPR